MIVGSILLVSSIRLGSDGGVSVGVSAVVSVPAEIERVYLLP